MLLGFILACGDSRICVIVSLDVSPASATVDHNVASPGNSVQFFAFGQGPNGCGAAGASLPDVTWSVSDAAHVSISNTADATFGTATCMHATASAVTVTATRPATSSSKQIAGTATLTCN